ncbi:phosphodiester glycosidase family protein [Alteriqipengyuania sp. WL0013]|uniref:phosphodiester glycosidase family protein n=1 Tax=Alteriqipengyuania sp. WL0013 TaxID=3110773 RepID=UPI002BFDDD99|nr:phosphodiester glycosidase family protein [Alteriqipengyuania sp. WL0013]MEB3414847.1 phosphodiester glycosidase family protein [Alteriqipengyuania sp. WL0013]
MRRGALLAVFALAACGTAAEEPEPGAKASAQPASACRSVTFEDARFTHCVADPKQHAITMALGGSRGQAYRGFVDYALDRPSDSAPVAFAMNAGMFDNAGKPIGYYVEGGKRLQELNRAKGLGNFHLLPNGVFYGTDGKWEIRTAEDFYESVKDRPAFGTQSGPMLVIGGELHPQIDEDGPSRFVRNGVGVDGEGRAHFVISEQPVSFGKLARLFRDDLATPNALYLDGSVSALWDPARERMDTGALLGPLVVVEKRQIPRKDTP